MLLAVQQNSNIRALPPKNNKIIFLRLELTVIAPYSDTSIHYNLVYRWLFTL